MFRAVTIGIWILVRTMLADRAALAIENLALRQQLSVLERNDSSRGFDGETEPLDLVRRLWSTGFVFGDRRA
jgi:hypothetical protein